VALNVPGKYRDFGLLILRVGIGAMFVSHGLPKMLGGPEMWKKVGGAMTYVGIDFVPVAWGFMAAFAETIGGACLVLGLFFRIACLFLLATMSVAATMHLGKGEGLKAASHAIEAGILFFSLLFTGPGKYSIDKK
jgi:putative oxidoreductase